MPLRKKVIEDVAELFSVLANPTRVRILAVLHRGEHDVSDAQVARLIADPAVSTDRVAGLIIEVAGSDLGERGGNFVKVTAENDRLSLLPEIGAQFEALKANAEGTLEATITSAQELTQAQLDDLVAGLKIKFNRAVNVQVAVDPELIGGAVIAIGDQVIDGSVKGRLQRMSFALQA